VSRPGPVPAALAAPALLLSSCADGTATAVRAAVVLTLLAGALALLRHRRPGTRAERPLRVEDREPLGRDSGVALVRAGPDRLLVGWGRDGVRLVARRGADGGRP
jgi:hypothetical protein